MENSIKFKSKFMDSKYNFFNLKKSYIFYFYTQNTD